MCTSSLQVLPLDKGSRVHVLAPTTIAGLAAPRHKVDLIRVCNADTLQSPDPADQAAVSNLPRLPPIAASHARPRSWTPHHSAWPVRAKPPCWSHTTKCNVVCSQQPVKQGHSVDALYQHTNSRCLPIPLTGPTMSAKCEGSKSHE
jgi:hypothetical protein